MDWQKCFDRYDRAKTAMYIDPPYPGNNCNYLHNMRDWDDHCHLADRLHQSKCKWILSSYDVPEIHNMYDGYNILSVQSYSGMRVKKNDTSRKLNREVLITNFDPPKLDSEEARVEQLKILEGGPSYRHNTS